MSRKRRQFSSQFKFAVALEAAKGLKTINQIAGENNVHPNQVSTWKRQLLTEGPSVFSNGAIQELEARAARETELFEQIGRRPTFTLWLRYRFIDPLIHLNLAVLWS